jgi:REP element-mobilizing transposase RayT
MFGEIKNEQMYLNLAGKEAEKCWLDIPAHFPHVILHEHVIMPNHIHGIIELDTSVIAKIHLPENPVGAKYLSPNSIVEDIVGAKNLSPDSTVENNVGAKYFSPVLMIEHISPEITDKINVGSKYLSPVLMTEHLSPEKNDEIENKEKNVSTEKKDEIDNRAKNISPLRDGKNNLPFRSPSYTLGSIIRGFKIGVTKWMRQNTEIYDVWQRNYHEHIIRNQKSRELISDYIKNNPSKWSEDTFYVS